MHGSHLLFPEVEEGELRRLLHEMGQTWALQSGTGTRCCGLCACPASNLGSLAPELLSSRDLNTPRHMTQNARCALALSSLSQGLPGMACTWWLGQALCAEHPSLKAGSGLVCRTPIPEGRVGPLCAEHPSLRAGQAMCAEHPYPGIPGQEEQGCPQGSPALSPGCPPMSCGLLAAETEVPS